MTTLHLALALLPEGFRRNVRIEIAAGAITQVSAENGPPQPGDRVVSGPTLPGLPNLHSHAFQRGMAGLSERRRALSGTGTDDGADDSFWSWREVMYAFLDRLSPDDMEACAGQAYVEMLESGFTSVAEFHYLHHDIDGRPYGDIAEMAARIGAAAQATGIGLTLLPVFYAHGGFGPKPANPGQRRFISTRDSFQRLHQASAPVLRGLPHAQLGLAPHSLRAATIPDIAALMPLAGAGPIHIHISEQEQEVADCLAVTGRRPVDLLLDETAVDERWCLIHATHITPGERARIAATGAVAGLCPITEANLGDGIFPAVAFLAEGGRFGVGSDSNVRIDALDELRMLEYGQRLRDRRRNRIAAPGESVGETLYAAALQGGAQALGKPIGAIAAGNAADFVELDPEHPGLAGATPRDLMDRVIFAAAGRPIRSVWTGGVQVVAEGRHVAREAISARYRSMMQRLLA